MAILYVRMHTHLLDLVQERLPKVQGVFGGFKNGWKEQTHSNYQ